MNDDEAWLTEASDIWWRESDGCAPVTDAEGEGDSGLFGAPGTGWYYFTIEFRGYLVSPDGETVIAVSELDPVEAELDTIRNDLEHDIFQWLIVEQAVDRAADELDQTAAPEWGGYPLTWGDES